MFGYTARRVIIRTSHRYTPDDESRSQDTETDGWYIDHPAARVPARPSVTRRGVLAFRLAHAACVAEVLAQLIPVSPSRIRCASPEFSQLSSHQFDFSTRLDFTMKPLSLMPSSTLTEPPVGQHLASSSFQMGLEKVSVVSSKFPPRVSQCSGSIFFSSASTAGRYFTLFGIPRSRMKYHSSIWPPLPDILELYPRTCLSPDFTISRRSIFVNGEKYMTGRNRPACLSTRSACRSPG